MQMTVALSTENGKKEFTGQNVNCHCEAPGHPLPAEAVTKTTQGSVEVEGRKSAEIGRPQQDKANPGKEKEQIPVIEEGTQPVRVRSYSRGHCLHRPLGR